MTAPLSTVLVRQLLLGAPIGLALGCLMYGGIGYRVAGTTGLYVGIALAVVFAIAGAAVGWHYLQAFKALEQQDLAFLHSTDDYLF